MKFDSTTYRLTDSAPLVRRFFIAGVIGLALSFIGVFTDSTQFFHSYLTAFVFWFTIAIGGLFFTLLGNLTGAVWSIVIRRVGEGLMMTLPWMILFFIPILFGMHDLFHWTHADAVADDQLLLEKSGFLNTGFFIVRTVAYFLIWFILTRILFRYSLNQDTANGTSIAVRLRQVSAPGMIVFALTITFASFDWVMSLDPHWYSTMFGVYIFSGSYLAVSCFLLLLLQYFEKKEILKGIISIEHMHDLGKLMFTFTVFWAYIAGAQYFLIWYANIPEETVWYLHRWEGSWKYFSLFIIAFHFVLPFFVLLFRASKRNRLVLRVMAIILLVMHYFDLYWLVMPNLHRHDVHFSWMDVTTLIGVGGLFLGLFIWQLSRERLVATGDPRLEDSINFVNH